MKRRRKRPTDLELKTQLEMQRLGYVPWKASSNNGKFNHDLGGFIDVVLLDLKRQQTVGVQVCTEGDWCKRFRKMEATAREGVEAWLTAGNLVEIQSWRRKKIVRGGVAVRWVLRRRPVVLSGTRITALAPLEAA